MFSMINGASMWYPLRTGASQMQAVHHSASFARPAAVCWLASRSAAGAREPAEPVEGRACCSSRPPCYSTLSTDRATIVPADRRLASSWSSAKSQANKPT